MRSRSGGFQGASRGRAGGHSWLQRQGARHAMLGRYSHEVADYVACMGSIYGGRAAKLCPRFIGLEGLELCLRPLESTVSIPPARLWSQHSCLCLVANSRQPFKRGTSEPPRVCT
jgi:hypothetical protein